MQKRILHIFYFHIISLICTVFKSCCPAHLFPNTPRTSFFKEKKSKRSHKTVEIKVFLHFFACWWKVPDPYKYLHTWTTQICLTICINRLINIKTNQETKKHATPCTYVCSGRRVSISEQNYILLPVRWVAVLRSWDVYPGSDFFPSRIPDAGSASKNLSILTQKNKKNGY